MGKFWILPYLLTIVFLWNNNPAIAQMPDYHVQVFNEEDGIHASKIIDMTMDDNNFLWLLYSDRVCRFDGKRIKEFKIEEDRLVSIEKDRKNMIWANSGSALYRFKNDKEGFLPVKTDTASQPQLISMVELPGTERRLLTESNDGDVSGNHGMRDAWVFKLDNAFSILWQKTHGGTADDVGRDLVENADGTLVFVGNSESTDIQGNNQGSNDIFAIKYNAIGGAIWAGTWGGSGSDVPYSIIETPDNGWLIAGHSDSNDGDVSGNHGGIDAWLLRLGPTSAFKWEKSLGGSGLDVARSIINAQNGGYTLAGYTDSNDGDVSGNNGALDYWVVKLDSDLATEDFETSAISLYPNPAEDYFTIDMASLSRNSKQLKIFDLLGQEIYNEKINTPQHQISTDSWPSGLYFVDLTDENGGSITGKLIVN